MGLPQIGLEAIYKDAGFQRGIEQFNKGISTATTNAEKGASAISRLGSVASGALTVGIGVAVTAFGALTAASKIGLDATLQWGEGLDKLGDMFGMSGEKASAFQYLANKVGLSVDEMGFGLNTLTRGLADMKAAQSGGEKTTAKSADSIQNMKEQLADANTQLERAKKRYAEAKKPTAEMGYAIQDAQKKIARLNADIAEGSRLVPKATKEASPFEKALKTLGVSAYNAKGKMKTFDEILPQIMDAFKKLPPSINKSDLAMTLFGARGGSKFLDFLSAGSDGLTDATKKVKQLGLELNTTQVNAIEDFGFAMNELKLGLSGVWNTIGIQVLPIARQFVDFLNTNIIPRVAELVQQNMPRFIQMIQGIGQAFGQFFESLRAGDYESAFGAIEMFLQALGMDEGPAIRIGEAIGSIGSEIGKLAKTLQTKGLGAMLKEWAADVWSWLTGKGGAIEQAGTKLGELKNKITEWIDKNGPATWDLIKNWAGNFWNWITDSKEGLLVTVATNMGNLAAKLEEWAGNKDTIERFQKIGENLAHDILQGIGNFFSNPTPSGENVLMVLWTTLDRARRNVIIFFASIGGAIAGGVISGVVGYFFGEDAKRRVTDGLTTFFTTLQKTILGPGGPVFGFGWALANTAWDGFVAQWKKLFGGWNPFGSSPSPTTGGGNADQWGGTGEKYANGGFVRHTGLSLVHSGEYVLTRAQVMQLAPVLAGANNSRTFNFTHNWPAGASASDRQWTEQMVRTVTHQEITSVLGSV